MKFLVTGSNGFVGKHLRKAVEASGDTFIGVPRSIFLDPIHLERFFHDTEPDIIVHLATYGNMFGQDDVLSTLEVNYTGLFNLLQVTHKMPYLAFVNVSSSSVGLDHQTFYSATKGGGEFLCRAFADTYNKPVMTMRPFTVYGEGDHDNHFLPTVFRKLSNGEELTLSPEPVHDWVHVDDIVEAIQLMPETIRDGWSGEVVEVGTGVGTTNQEIVDKVATLMGITKPKVRKQKILRPYDSKDWVAEYAFRYNDMILLDDGLKRYHEWYTKEKEGGEK